MKTEVYSWRVSPEVKADLETEARSRKTSVSALLDLAVRDWLQNREAGSRDLEEQARLHAEAEKSIGAFAANNSDRAERSRALVRQRLARRYGR